MTVSQRQTAATDPQRGRRFAGLVAIALAIGLVAGAVSYLSGSLSIPGPARMATTAVLEERGAERYMSFCGNTFEPRFWPECTNGATEWRERGASRLVEYCVDHRPSRLFTTGDCEAEGRPAFALSGGPGWDDAAIGGLAALVAFVALLLISPGRRAVLHAGKTSGST